jgi:Spy/CpxP family protein refolding chaperone
MNVMKKLLIALTVAATSAIAFAQTPADSAPHRHGHHRGFHQLGAKLNLTDAQKQQMKDIRSADRASNQQLYADFGAKLHQLRALRQANDPGAAALKAEIESMKPQIEAARKANRQAMLAVLTPDQRAQLKEARQSRGLGVRGSGVRRGNAMRHAVASKLNLTDEQKSQFQQLRKANQDKNQQLFADAKAKRDEFHSLKKANDPRAADVKAELEALRPQLKAARQAQHEAFLSILTPEQRSQLEQWKSRREQQLR